MWKPLLYWGKNPCLLKKKKSFFWNPARWNSRKMQLSRWSPSRWLLRCDFFQVLKKYYKEKLKPFYEWQPCTTYVYCPKQDLMNSFQHLSEVYFRQALGSLVTCHWNYLPVLLKLVLFTFMTPTTLSLVQDSVKTSKKTWKPLFSIILTQSSTIHTKR